MKEVTGMRQHKPAVPKPHGDQKDGTGNRVRDTAATEVAGGCRLLGGPRRDV